MQINRARSFSVHKWSGEIPYVVALLQSVTSTVWPVVWRARLYLAPSEMAEPIAQRRL